MSKLIRDGIPDLMQASGINCRIRTADEVKYRLFLAKKLIEEANEYLESQSVDELADLLEVMKAIVVERNMDWHDLEQIRLKKLAHRGGFQRRWILES